MEEGKCRKISFEKKRANLKIDRQKSISMQCTSSERSYTILLTLCVRSFFSLLHVVVFFLSVFNSESKTCPYLWILIRIISFPSLLLCLLPFVSPSSLSPRIQSVSPVSFLLFFWKWQQNRIGDTPRRASLYSCSGISITVINDKYIKMSWICVCACESNVRRDL